MRLLLILKGTEMKRKRKGVQKPSIQFIGEGGKGGERYHREKGRRVARKQDIRRNIHHDRIQLQTGSGEKGTMRGELANPSSIEKREERRYVEAELKTYFSFGEKRPFFSRREESPRRVSTLKRRGRGIPHQYNGKKIPKTNSLFLSWLPF